MQPIKDIAARIRPGNGYNAITPEQSNQIERVMLSQLDTRRHPLMKTAVNAARKWAERKKTHPAASLVLVASQVYHQDGRPDIDRTGYGVGKTHIARAIMWAQYITQEDGTPVAPCGRFFMAADLIDLLAGGDRGNKPGELIPKRKDINGSIMGGAHVVVIDDVGTEGVIPYVSKEMQLQEMQARYFEIVNYCYDNGRENGISMVITANMSLDSLAAHMGGRCWSRLLEMAPAGFMIDLTGVPDYRRQTSGR